MASAPIPSPALLAAQAAEAEVSQCLAEKRSFLLEAGAGAGKTYSLVEALKSLLAREGTALRRNNQQIACITYTNAATDVIIKRIDGSKQVAVSTTHAFCWSLIGPFQSVLRKEFQALPEWKEKLEAGPAVASQRIEYELGYRKLTDEIVSLDHDDILKLTASLLSLPKFQAIVAGRFPYILIDEYQDTAVELMSAIKSHLFARKGGPVVGLFGDHWQRIYEDACGHVTDPGLHEIGKKANFRSATSVVAVLNKMRPELPQAVADESFVGSANVFHTNGWTGTRQPSGPGGHWTGDLPAPDAHQFLETCIAHLKQAGWDFAPDKTKVLLLTHNGLAAEQGYPTLPKVFPYTDLYIKKTDDHIAFLADKLEPAIAAYQAKQFGKMFDILGEEAPRLSSQSEKQKWSDAMKELISIRESGSVGAVIDHLLSIRYPRLPEKVIHRERSAQEWQPVDGVETPDLVTRVKKLRGVPYAEIIALVGYLEGHTPFTTKHSVKGDEFENVLVVLGRGWNKYNFDQYLQWHAKPASIPKGKDATFERNRNLFYVACSRPKTRLTLLFTQVLTPAALALLQSWFHAGNVIDVGMGKFPEVGSRPNAS